MKYRRNERQEWKSCFGSRNPDHPRYQMVILGLFLLVLLSPARVRTETLSGDDIDRLMQKGLAAWKVPGASIAVVQGNNSYIQGYGVRELGSSRRVTPETLFAIGSTTKAFTTAAMALLIDEGKMRWDDPVQRHLPSFRLSDPLANANVTLRDIVSHRTGLTRHDMLWYGSPWNRAEILRRIGLVSLTHSFRSTYYYQNIMFLAAGSAVEGASGRSWEDFVRTRLFEPLGIRHANFSSVEAEKYPDHASPHIQDADGIRVVAWRNLDSVGPAGSINAGARDLERWIRFQLGDGELEGKRIVSASHLQETHSPQTIIRMEGETREENPESHFLNYGLGWRVQDYRGHFMLSHAGVIGGFRAYIALVPEATLGIMVLSNLAGRPSLPEAVTSSLVDVALGSPSRDWNSFFLDLVKRRRAKRRQDRDDLESKRHHGTRPSREQPAYVGKYENPAYGTAGVTLEGGVLLLRWSYFLLALKHYHYDVFMVDDKTLGGELVSFQLDREGAVHTMKFLEVEFQRFLEQKR